MLLPLIGGFNDGKYIESLNRNFIKVAKPSEYKSISHKEENIGFEYEIYEIKTISVNNEIFKVFVIEDMQIDEAVRLLIDGYKQFNKKKCFDINNKKEY